MAKRAGSKVGRTDQAKPIGKSGASAVAAPSAAPAAPSGPAADALRLFQSGFEALQAHRYSEGAKAFRTLLTAHSGERALLDRVRVYLDLCERELKKAPGEPQTIAERLIAATAALNNGQDARAESLAKAVLATDPRQDLALYQLAVVEARRGNSAAAVDRLRQAIDLSAEASAQARFDPDFESLRDVPAFRELTDPATSGARRQRRGRAER